MVDDDLSRNGTFVNGSRLRGRRRLEDRDVVRVGVTEVLYRDPSSEAGETPRVAGHAAFAAVTAGQRRVLVALCRPLLDAVERATHAQSVEGSVQSPYRCMASKLAGALGGAAGLTRHGRFPFWISDAI